MKAIIVFQWGRALRADCVNPAQAAVFRLSSPFQWGRALRADCVWVVTSIPEP